MINIKSITYSQGVESRTLDTADISAEKIKALTTVANQLARTILSNASITVDSIHLSGKNLFLYYSYPDTHTIKIENIAGRWQINGTDIENMPNQNAIMANRSATVEKIQELFIFHSSQASCSHSRSCRTSTHKKRTTIIHCCSHSCRRNDSSNSQLLLLQMILESLRELRKIHERLNQRQHQAPTIQSEFSLNFNSNRSQDFLATLQNKHLIPNKE